MLRKISLITCVKNEEEFIGRMIESTKNLPREIIVVDTGSTDKTKEICNGYSNLKLIDMDPSGCEDAIFEARKIALKNATSEWVLNLDADEELSAELVDEIIQFILANEYDCLSLKRITFLKKHPHVYEHCQRLFRNNADFKFQHSLRGHSFIMYPEKYKVKNSDGLLFHFGWFSLSKEKEIEKRELYETYEPFLPKLKEIPKILHFFWTGKNFTYLDYMAVFSAWKFNKDFKIYMWYAGDVDSEWWIKINEFCEKQDITDLIKSNMPDDALASNKANFVRYYKLFTIGGVYLDTDTITLKPLASLLKFETFAGYESRGIANNGIMGSVPGNEIFKDCLRSSVVVTKTTGIYAFNEIVNKRLDEIRLFPADKFNPIYWGEWERYFNPMEKIEIDGILEKATTIHYWSKMSRPIMEKINADYNENNLIGRALQTVLQEV